MNDALAYLATAVVVLSLLAVGAAWFCSKKSKSSHYQRVSHAKRQALARSASSLL